MARKAITITPSNLLQIEKMASRGMTVEQICSVLRIDKSTLYRKAKQKKEIIEALERGRAGGIMKITNVLFDQAIAGDMTAVIFYLRNRDAGNWNKQSQKIEVEGEVVSEVVFKIVDDINGD